jgi:hypothetical protein
MADSAALQPAETGFSLDAQTWHVDESMPAFYRARLHERLIAAGYPLDGSVVITAALAEQHYPKAQWLRDAATALLTGQSQWSTPT